MKIKFRITLVLLIMINLAIILSGVFIYQNTGKVIQGVIERNILKLLEFEKNNVQLLIKQELVMPYYLTRDQNVINLLENSNLEAEKNNVIGLLTDYYNGRVDHLEAVFFSEQRGHHCCRCQSRNDWI